MKAGLAVSDVVNVSVFLSARARGTRNFGAALIIGDSGVLNTRERIRQYSNIEEVMADYGTATPEYKAAALHFAQIPQSNLLYIGKWAREATHAILLGRPLMPAELPLHRWTAITDGAMQMRIDGVVAVLVNLDFSAARNMNGVAAVVSQALDQAVQGATCTWDSLYKRFRVTGAATGAGAATIDYADPVIPATGTDISDMLGLAMSNVTPEPVNGVDAESAVDAAAILADASADWYALEWACRVFPSDADYIDVSEMIESSSARRIHCITSQNPAEADPVVTGSLSEQLHELGYNSTFIMYSSKSPYAIASIWARFATVNYERQNSAITGKFKVLPGVAPEYLSETQAATLRARNCNVYAQYANGAAIFQEGVMSGGWFTDERVALDWLANAVQTDVFNLFYTEPNKIPQTDAGTKRITTVIAGTMERAVNNGVVAPGQWNGPPLGQIETGAFLPHGYYLYAPLVATQSQTDREQRKSVPITVLAKFAGAVHFADVLIYAER